MLVYVSCPKDKNFGVRNSPAQNPSPASGGFQSQDFDKPGLSLGLARVYATGTDAPESQNPLWTRSFHLSIEFTENEPCMRPTTVSKGLGPHSHPGRMEHFTRHCDSFSADKLPSLNFTKRFITLSLEGQVISISGTSRSLTLCSAR